MKVLELDPSEIPPEVLDKKLEKYYKALQEHPSPIDSNFAYQSEDEVNITFQQMN